MRALRVHELIGPDGLRIDEVDPPKPTAGEVLIEVKAAGLNFPDVLLTQGKYQFQPPLPFSPGGEVSGIVKEVGDGVEHVKVGDRVAATMIHGAFAEQVVVPAQTTAKLPDNVPFETGAGFLLTYATTYYALKDRAHLQPGETLLVLGAAGGVGTSAIELGKVMGAEVIAAASTDEKLEACKALGADKVINYSTEKLKDRAKQLSNGGVDVIYDPVGGDYAEQALRAIGWEGRFLVIGFAAGDIPKIPLNLALLKSCQIVGVFWGAFVMRTPEKNRDNVQQLLSWLGEGKLEPRIDGTYPFEKAGEALGRMMRREVKGKLVLTT